MNVLIQCDIDEENLDWECHRKFAENLLHAAGEVDSELSITFMDDDGIQSLNRKYRGKDEPTDVLSFSMREGEPVGQQTPLGDIVISLETAARQATDFGHSITDEINELIFHGLLHLLGYDHEIDQGEWSLAEENLRRRLQNHRIFYIPKGMSNC